MRSASPLHRSAEITTILNSHKKCFEKPHCIKRLLASLQNSYYFLTLTFTDFFLLPALNDTLALPISFLAVIVKVTWPFPSVQAFLGDTDMHLLLYKVRLVVTTLSSTAQPSSPVTVTITSSLIFLLRVKRFRDNEIKSTLQTVGGIVGEATGVGVDWGVAAGDGDAAGVGVSDTAVQLNWPFPGL